MLGERIGEETGRITSQRVLPSNSGSPRVEVTMQTKGKLLGVDYSGTFTYQCVERSSGIYFGDGEGVLMTRDGESVNLRAIGSGRPGDHPGSLKWRGAVCFLALPPKLSRLSGLAGVFEHEVDENGNCQTRIFEWK